LAPATSITILPGASGTGSQDATFLANNGQLLFADPDVGANTLSTGALTAIAATNDIIVQATDHITFNDLGGTLALQTGAGHSATFSTDIGGGQAITFSTSTNTLATGGGGIVLDARTTVTAASLNSSGGSITLAGSDLEIDGTVNSGTARTILENST